MSNQQYLRKENVYQRQLLAFAKLGKRYIVACTDESQEPAYEAFKYATDAAAAATKYASVFGSPHVAFELVQDEGGDWSTDYQDIRLT